MTLLTLTGKVTLQTLTAPQAGKGNVTNTQSATHREKATLEAQTHQQLFLEGSDTGLWRRRFSRWGHKPCKLLMQNTLV